MLRGCFLLIYKILSENKYRWTKFDYSKIIDIKYTSGWVNIPAYRFLIQNTISFILNNETTMDQLNRQISEYMEYAPNDHFFGYEDDEISKSFSPDQIIPLAIKYLFVANVMSKFSILFKN